jgi:hypothetical protein
MRYLTINWWLANVQANRNGDGRHKSSWAGKMLMTMAEGWWVKNLGNRDALNIREGGLK